MKWVLVALVMNIPVKTDLVFNSLDECLAAELQMRKEWSESYNQAKKSGVARCVGRGLNVWSTVHIEDLVELYALAAGGSIPAGTFLFAENGETNFRDLAEAIKKSLGLAHPVEEWPVADAVAEWGEGMAKFALGSNSRIRAVKSRQYGWKPTRNNLMEDAARMCHSTDMRVAVH